MSRFSIIGPLILISILFSQVSGEPPGDKSKSIPLDKIWAYEMPGARDITTLEKSLNERADKGPLWLIYESMVLRAGKLKYKDLARPAFAVSGGDCSALRAAQSVLVDGTKPRKTFSKDEELTIVFFSEPVSKYRVRVGQVARTDNEVRIDYQLEAGVYGQDYHNFALIPVGKMSIGKYQVNMRQLPHEQTPIEIKKGFKPLDKEWSNNYLSAPFRFSVAEKRE